jgi:hypothetical protein
MSKMEKPAPGNVSPTAEDRITKERGKGAELILLFKKKENNTHSHPNVTNPLTSA